MHALDRLAVVLTRPMSPTHFGIFLDCRLGSNRHPCFTTSATRAPESPGNNLL
jgi:hypothetical protein